MNRRSLLLVILILAIFLGLELIIPGSEAYHRGLPNQANAAGTSALSPVRARGKLPPVPEMASAGTFHWTPGALSRLLQEQALDPVASPRKYRGGPGTFRALAPSIVVVRTWRGHGTGFVIDEKGLVLTNYHVIDGGTYVDPKGPSSYARIDVGRLQESGRMKRIPEDVRGYVVAVDPNRDLALLRLDHVPKGIERLSVVPMADGDPTTGSECAMMGHPTSGMLWTYSEGRVSSLGQAPGDLVDFVVPLLAASSVDRAVIETMLSSAKSLTIVLSSCLANPGDSGGPLVDSGGRLIGVTFGVPADVSRRSLTYHIALSEVKSFLNGVKEAPILLVPDAWQVDPMVTLPQRNVLRGQGQGLQFLFDLDVDTPGELIEKEAFGALINERRFDAEAALHFFRDRRLAFYDTNNDSKMDVILVDNDPDDTADQRYRLQGETWRFEDGIDTPFLDPSLCGPLAETFRTLAKTLGLK